MKNLLNPKWIFFIHTLPVVVLFMLLIGQYQIIHTALDATNINIWIGFGLALIVLLVSNVVYAFIKLRKKEKLSKSYAILSFVAHFLFLYVYSIYERDLLPRSIPNWMISTDLYTLLGTFLMPSLAFSFFIAVLTLTKDMAKEKAKYNFAYAVAIPMGWYLVFWLLLPLRRSMGWRGFNQNFFLFFVLSGTVAFLFFLVRGLYLLQIRSKKWEEYHLLVKVTVALILPIIGLLVNSGLEVFGNFSDPWFFILTLLNTIFLLLPNVEDKKIRLGIFFLRNITFIYTLYFMLVFLPYLPMSVFAILAFGLGILMLAPLGLFVIHIQELHTDYLYLKKYFQKGLVLLTSIVGLLVIPVVITNTYLGDKEVLTQTLDYIYYPDYSKPFDINLTALKRSIGFVEENTGRSTGMFGRNTPYLSGYYSWLVLDNMTISNSKIQKIKSIFFGGHYYGNIRNRNRRANDTQNVKIKNIDTRSYFDHDQNSWVSWVDLELINTDSLRGFGEYETTIDLPDGCWISDYYLYVGDRKEMGILSEKKAAMWIYDQIRSRNRDPGLLHYLKGNKVAFRVFPFAKSEVRRTGIQFIHKEPIHLDFDGELVVLGAENGQKIEASNPKDPVIYISKKEKQKLEKVKRSPYFHFVLDMSENEESTEKLSYIQMIDDILATNKMMGSNHKISFVNYKTETENLDNNWKKSLKSKVFEGGFYLERALEEILIDNYKECSNKYPVIVVVSTKDDLRNAILEYDFSNLEFTYPDGKYFYKIKENNFFDVYSFGQPNTKIESVYFENQFAQPVLAYPNAQNPIAYLVDNQESSILLNDTKAFSFDYEIQERSWASGLHLEGSWKMQNLNPQMVNEHWNGEVIKSFKSRILTPHTSYIVVETEAQKQMLFKKQKQVLNGKVSLDLVETRRMSEPKIWWFLLIFGIYFIWKRKMG